MTKKQQEEPQIEIDLHDLTIKQIAKNYGENLLISGQYLIDNPPIILSWSPALDLSLGGGVIPGVIVLSGRQKIGKTASFLTLARNAQRVGYKIYYFDIEARIKPRDLKVHELKTTEPYFNIFKSTPQKVLYDKDFLGMARDILIGVPKSLVILDSISQLLSMDRAGADLSDRKRSPESSVISNFLREMSNIIPQRENFLCCVTHRVANLNNTQAMYYETGGTKVQYLLETKLMGISSEPFPKTSNRPLGQKIKWTVVTSSLGPPGIPVESYFRYNYGLDEALEIIDLGVSCGVVKQKGSWYEYDEVKGQGIENFRTALKNTPQKLDAIYQSVKEIMGVSA